jgi:hypothetical protein
LCRIFFPANHARLLHYASCCDPSRHHHPRQP